LECPGLFALVNERGEVQRARRKSDRLPPKWHRENGKSALKSSGGFSSVGRRKLQLGWKGPARRGLLIGSSISSSHRGRGGISLGRSRKEAGREAAREDKRRNVTKNCNGRDRRRRERERKARRGPLEGGLRKMATQKK